MVKLTMSNRTKLAVVAVIAPGAWEDATGYIRAMGTLAAAGEIGQGEYIGKICTE